MVNKIEATINVIQNNKNNQFSVCFLYNYEGDIMQTVLNGFCRIQFNSTYPLNSNVVVNGVALPFFGFDGKIGKIQDQNGKILYQDLNPPHHSIKQMLLESEFDKSIAEKYYELDTLNDNLSL